MNVPERLETEQTFRMCVFTQYTTHPHPVGVGHRCPGTHFHIHHRIPNIPRRRHPHDVDIYLIKKRLPYNRIKLNMAFTGYFHHPYDPQYRLAIHSSVIHYFFPHRRFIPKKLFSQRLRQNDVIESRFQPAGISLYHRKMENIKKGRIHTHPIE